MRETKFIEQNKQKWAEFEDQLKQDKKDTQKLNELFIQVTDDLSYARTFYPNRTVRYYLNFLAQKVYFNVYKAKGRRNKILTFWKNELPQLIYESRKELTLSFCIFLFSVFIGVLSSHHNPDFPGIILGEKYITMTKENISKGDPMAVYKSSSEYNMMLGITVNNLRVAFLTFLMGIILGVGTIAFLMYNGIMIGAFQYFFFSQGIFSESVLTIWLHGTLEISAIIIAGGAGITLGRGLVFPGTYSRLQAFQITGRRGLKILIGILPIIVLAAIIESFLTRYTSAPMIIRAGLIIFSLTFVVVYFIYLPLRTAKRGFESLLSEARVAPAKDMRIPTGVIRSNGEIFKDAFIFFRKLIRPLLAVFSLSALVYAVSMAFLLHEYLPENMFNTNFFFIQKLFNYNYYAYDVYIEAVPFWLVLFSTNVLNAFLNISFVYYFLIKEISPEKKSTFFQFLWNKGVGLLLFTAATQFLMLMSGLWVYLILLLLLPVLSVTAYGFASGKKDFMASLPTHFSLSFSSFWKLMSLNGMLVILCILCFFISNSPLLMMYFEFINWNLPIMDDHQWLITIFFYTFSSIFFMNLFLGIYYASIGILYHTLHEIKFAENLMLKISTIGNRNKT